MPLPGEEHAWWVIESPLTTPSQKAEARTKLVAIEEIRRENAENERRWRERQGAR